MRHDNILYERHVSEMFTRYMKNPNPNVVFARINKILENILSNVGYLLNSSLTLDW